MATNLLSFFAKQRTLNVGGSEFTYLNMNEGITFKHDTVSASIDALIRAPLHRADMLDPNLSYIGAGFSSGNLVLTYGYNRSSLDVSVYP